MTKQESLIPVSSLGEMFSMNDDGALFWKNRPVSHFKQSEKRSAEHICANWNSRYAGKQAIDCVTPFGHRTGRINDRLVYAHRVVWAMRKGAWPANEIDHINGDPSDNNINNLRDVPHKENLRNQSTGKNNTSGANGVRFYKPRSKWTATICVDGKSCHIGYFDSFDDAVIARKNADSKYGFHNNHGRISA